MPIICSRTLFLALIVLSLFLPILSSTSQAANVYVQGGSGGGGGGGEGATSSCRVSTRCSPS